MPLVVYELINAAGRLASHKTLELSSLLLSTDLIDYTGLPAIGPNAYGGHEFILWYVHCIVHIVLIFAVLLFVSMKVLRLGRPATAALIGAVVLGLIGRFVLPTLFLPNVWKMHVPEMSFFNHAPSSHLATFALAAAAGFLTHQWRLALVAGALGYALLSAPLYGAIDAAAIVVVAGVLALAPKLVSPRAVSGPLYVIAGASFFIYLLHFKVLSVFNHLHLPAWVAFPVAIGVGVAAWRGWNWCGRKLGRDWPRGSGGVSNPMYAERGLVGEDR